MSRRPRESGSACDRGERLACEARSRRWVDLLAGGLSVLLSPYVVAAATAAAVTSHEARDAAQVLTHGVIAVTFCALVPFGYTLWLVRTGRATDIHAAVREQRPPIFAVALVSALISVILLWSAGASQDVLAMGWAYVGCGVVFAIVNEGTKISLHTGLLAGSAVVLLHTFGLIALLPFVLLPVAGWARLRRGRHTLTQAVLGALLGAGVTAAILKLMTTNNFLPV